MIVKKTAYARAALVGNPSDGYFGKTISVILKNFRAEVAIFESPELKIEPNRSDHSAFKSMADLAEDIRFSGYYGGMRLIKAAVKKFHEYLVSHEVEYANRNFTVQYDSSIPVRLGLAGSSAIVTATIQALMEFFEVEIPKPYLPTLALRVETEELGIQGGLQDRVAQVYGGCVYMDFNRDHLEEFQYGIYEEIDTSLLPPLYVAYRKVLSEGTEVTHNRLRERWERGDSDVRQAMERLGELTEEFYQALKQGDVKRMSELMNENFDVRTGICKIGQANWNLINAARNVEASANFTGSGGAIVGICRDEKMFRELERAMKEIDAAVIKPIF
ncbi:GHMP kinase [Candidatus Sumerlaeota bacterium]|nr:GHMP kinase [Candidatus Sumerlaeota bacterium]